MSPDNDLEREILQLEQRYAENAHGLVFAHLADAYRRAGEYSKAEGLLIHGLKTHPSYTSAYNVLGRVYLDSERYDDAQVQFARVLELDPQNLISLKALGDLAARRGHVADAREWYERMLQIDPRSEEAREGLARLETPATPRDQSAAPEPPAEEPLEAAAPSVGAEPAPSGREDFELPAETAASEPGSAVADPPGTGEAAMPEIEGEELETVEKVEADYEPIEGLMADEGFGGVSMDEISADPDEAEEPPVGEEQEAEPWAVGAADEQQEPPGFDPSNLEQWQAPDSDEPWSDSIAGSTDEEDSEPAAEPSAEEEAEPWLTAAESEDLEMSSMDDWSPGFVVGELVEGQAAEELRPEEILEGLDAEYTFAAGEDLDGESEQSGTTEGEAPREGVVTETMAELYASQGLYSDALAVYRRLAQENPDREHLQSRIVDMERRIEEAGSVPDEDELVRLMELTQPVEEASAGQEPPSEEPQVESTAPPPESDVLELEDQAPVAGFDQLDPFAASFDTLAAKTPPSESFLEEPPAAAEPSLELEEEPGPAPAVEPLGSEPVSIESLAEEPPAEEPPAAIDRPEGEFVPSGLEVEKSADEVKSADEMNEEEVPQESEFATADEGITAVDSIWELTEVGASDTRQRGPEQEVDHTVDEPDEGEVPVRVDREPAAAMEDQPPTMEDYVDGLLAFDVESLFKAGSSSASAQEGEPPPHPEASNTEDLEQFQEWLRSLKR